MDSKNNRGIDLEESQATGITVAIIVFPSLALIALLLRLYTRIFILGRHFVDDTLAIAATVRGATASGQGPPITETNGLRNRLAPFSCAFVWALVSL
jgi:hypothetical protein